MCPKKVESQTVEFKDRDLRELVDKKYIESDRR
jgi:hypothetical protein